MEIERIISGGQTGADRGAFDAALSFGIEIGGWVPKGRHDENGLIPGSYPNLVEAETDDPDDRTETNVRNSDATLILSNGLLNGGSEFTRKSAVKLGKPWKHVILAETTTGAALANIMDWLSQVKPRVLNVAGPRASEDPRIYNGTKTIMERIFMNQNLDILVGLRASVLSQCGSWDQIRWQVPSWFCTLGTVSLGAVNYFGVEHYNAKREAEFFAALGIFGCLCLMLLYKLGSYERQAINKFNHHTIRKFLPLDDTLVDVLTIERPFAFTWAGIPLTATFWFFLYMALLSGIFLARAAWLRWNQKSSELWVIAIAVAFEIVVLWVAPAVFRRVAKIRARCQPLRRAARTP